MQFSSFEEEEGFPSYELKEVNGVISEEQDKEVSTELHHFHEEEGFNSQFQSKEVDFDQISEEYFASDEVIESVPFETGSSIGISERDIMF